MLPQPKTNIKSPIRSNGNGNGGVHTTLPQAAHAQSECLTDKNQLLKH